MSVHPIGRLTTPIMLAAILTLAGCGSGSPAASAPAGGGSSTAGEPSEAAEPSTAAEPSEAEATPGTALTACELVSPADIEAALGLDPGTVAEGSLEQISTTLDPATNECRYEDQEWGELIINVTPTTGDNTFSALSKTYGDTAEAVAVGDGAYWFEDNDRGYFLKGSVMAFLQFVFIADGTPFRDPTIALGEALVAKI